MNANYVNLPYERPETSHTGYDREGKTGSTQPQHTPKLLFLSCSLDLLLCSGFLARPCGSLGVSWSCCCKQHELIAHFLWPDQLWHATWIIFIIFFNNQEQLQQSLPGRQRCYPQRSRTGQHKQQNKKLRCCWVFDVLRWVRGLGGTCTSFSDETPMMGIMASRRQSSLALASRPRSSA